VPGATGADAGGTGGLVAVVAAGSTGLLHDMPPSESWSLPPVAKHETIKSSVSLASVLMGLSLEVGFAIFNRPHTRACTQKSNRRSLKASFKRRKNK